MVTMLIVGMILSTPQVPGAREVRLLARQDIADGLQSGMTYISVVSDDGAALYTHGRMRRFLLNSSKPAPAEDVFFGYADGRPVTHTTS